MRLLANENLPREVVSSLRDAGHDVAWVRETAAGATDLAVLEMARVEGRLLLTLDVDFATLAFRGGPIAAGGIVLLRPRAIEPSRLSTQIATALARELPWQVSFVTVEPDRIRVRPLPRRKDERRS